MQEAGPSKKLNMSSEGVNEAGVDSEEEVLLEGPPVKRPRVVEDEEDVRVADNSGERLDVEDVSEEGDDKEGNSEEAGQADSGGQSKGDQAVGEEALGRGSATEAAAILDDEANEESDEDKEEEEEDDVQLQEEVAVRGEVGEEEGGEEATGMEREQLGGDYSDDEVVDDSK